MTRTLAFLVVLAACGQARGVAPTPTRRSPSVLAELHHGPGEDLVWEVYWQGVAIGRARLTASARELHASFGTGRLASALASVRYELRTGVARGAPRTLTERVTIDGDREQFDAQLGRASYTQTGVVHPVPGGHQVHSLASAVAAVRAWSRGPAAPGFLWLLYGGALYRLDVPAPARDGGALRIDAVVRALDRARSFDITIVLAANLDRTPLRFVVESGSHRITAELIEANTAIAMP